MKHTKLTDSLPVLNFRQRPHHKRGISLLFTLSVLIVSLVSLAVSILIMWILVRLGAIPSADASVVFVTVLPLADLIAIAVVLILLLSAGRLLTTPVNNTIKALNQLASGDYSVRLPMRKSFQRVPALREAADAFNDLASELENTEMLRSDFVNNFSHEFKTPIVSIAGFAKLLKRGNLTADEQAEYLDIIEQESLRLSYMATRVLDLTRVENQSILSDLTTYNLSEQLRSCVLMLEEKWSRKDLTPELEFDELQIHASEELLRQVWLNLIDNAVKFAEPGTPLELSAVREKGSITVSVCNTGPEIPPEKREAIFRKFYQAEESHAHEGNGIGLAIVRRVVELHGGSVDLRCEGGKTTFLITLPTAL